jgi:hypothetical protein
MNCSVHLLTYVGVELVNEQVHATHREGHIVYYCEERGPCRLADRGVVQLAVRRIRVL